MIELGELDDEYYEEPDLDEPIEGICFHVLTEFNLSHSGVKRKLQSKRDRRMFFEPQATHPKAMENAETCADAIQKQFKGSSIKRVDPVMLNDEFHLYVIDQSHLTIAKIGVIIEDYRDFTIH